MDYTLAGIIGIQALLALILWLQNRQLDAQTVLVGVAMQDLIDRGIITIVEDKDDADIY